MDKRPRPARRIRQARVADTMRSEHTSHSVVDSAWAVRELPVLPVRNTVVLPGMVLPLFVDRDPALQAVEAASADGQTILLVAQRSDQIVDPLPDDIYSVGVECAINRVLRMPDGTSSVLIHGLRRFRIESWLHETPYGRVRGVAYDDAPVNSDQAEALARTALGYFEKCTRLSQRLNEDMYVQALNIESSGELADFIIAQLEPALPIRQEFLEIFDPQERLRKTCLLLLRELNVLEIEGKIQADVQREVDRGQREFYLREQMKVIQQELGEHDPALREISELRERIEATGMPDEVSARALRELARLEAMPSMAPEYSVLRNYLDWLIALPWSVASRDNLNLRHVAQILDANHFGLEKVKERILEFLAVRKLVPEGRAPILCLVGPPGVGKTSLGRSVAEAMGRSFVRVSLGGVRDEAEIRGHRRTYVSALPGRILQSMKQAKTTNPVFVLDEIDKLASDFRGDPSAALLEVLDPEQNNSFSDHFLEAPYDLSKVFFVLTANVLHTIPAPLRDRMEIIEVPGYTEEEKAQIAHQFLIPRQMRDTGLNASRIEIDDRAVRRIIREYTFEAGVRGLDRELAAIMRRVARRIVDGRRQKASVTSVRVPAYLGSQKYFPTEAEEVDQVGVATGLAWTAAGGDLTTVEVMAVPGHGGVQLTGQLGDVMKESAQAALTFTRARAHSLGLPAMFHESNDIHIHLPSASIPKDGPSAGVTMAIAIMSALSGRPVRRDVAMTGELTLRGRVLPVGGIKEKVLAAHRAGIRTIVLPRRNLKDLDDVTPDIREQLSFAPVESMDEVIAVALCDASHRGEALASPTSGSLTRGAVRPSRPLSASLPASGRVARPRSRRDVVVAG